MKDGIVGYLLRQEAGEFRLVVNTNGQCYIHPLGRDGETFDFRVKVNLNEISNEMKKSSNENWIPVGERLPEFGHWCLAYSWRGVIMASYFKHEWRVYNHDAPGQYMPIDAVSHWMPSPGPPKI